MHEQIVVQSRFRDGPGLEVGGKNQQWFRNFLHMRRIWQRTDTWRRWSRHCGSARFGAWWLGYFAQFRMESGAVPRQYRKCRQCRGPPEFATISVEHRIRMQVDDAPQEQLYAALAREVLPRLEALAWCRSTAEMEAHPAYRAIAPLIARSLATPHIADFRHREAPPRPRYRFLAWNIERGTQFEAQLEAFRLHPYLKT